MVWTFIAFLLIIWLLGWSFHVAGSLIHVFLIVALVIALANLILGRRTV